MPLSVLPHSQSAARWQFGVQLDPDMKGLIVGGDTDVVLDVLRELRAKTDNARRRRGSADTRRGSVSSEREAGQNASSTEASSEVSLDLRKLDTCQNLEESSNALDFLVISMCKKLGVRAKQAAALLTANTKYLSHMMEKGIKGSFEAVDAWYAEVNWGWMHFHIHNTYIRICNSSAFVEFT